MSHKTQTYKTHRRLDPAYHFILSPVAFGLSIWAVYNAATDFSSQSLFLAMLTVVVLGFGYIIRIYALKNQNRIIRIEMRYRYHLLTGKRFESLEHKLGMGSIVALRFASDEELPGLIETALQEKLKPEEIKQRIGNWQSDFQRV